MDQVLKALVVGIDHYTQPNGLEGCVRDARTIAGLFKNNENRTANFDVTEMLSSETRSVGADLLWTEIKKLFSTDAETVLFYFAGHGILDPETNRGWLVTQDGRRPNWGVALEDVLNLANGAYPNIKSTVIILDCCHSGAFGELSGAQGASNTSVIGTGVTILTAARRDQAAEEFGAKGLFTEILIDGLRGAASDVLGRVTPAALYTHVDQSLGAWEQRPVYKANVQNFITLREVAPKIPKEVILNLIDYFDDPNVPRKLDPSYEPDRGEEAEQLKDIKVDDANVAVYRDLQLCNRHGLVEPIDYEHMWHTAVFCGRCQLTAPGKHMWRLVKKNRIK